jgi:hypothetical protein
MPLAENTLTTVEELLKLALETRLQLGGQPVPVRIVTPDPDFVELELPCVTMQLVDIRRDPARMDNERRVVADPDAMTAEMRPPTQPYNLHFSIAPHADQIRDERLLLEQILLLFDEVPVISSAIQEYYVAPDRTFGDRSSDRDVACAVGILVRARLEPGPAETVLLARDHRVTAKEI